MIKRYLHLVAILLFTSTGFAQETIELHSKISGNVEEVFHTLKSNKNIKHGQYKAVYKNKVTIASGEYDNNKRIGLWQFSDAKGVVMQTYDYTKSKIYYEAPEETSSKLRYYADKLLQEGDKVAKPIKIGGRYYGYLPYLTLFTLPKEFNDIDRGIVIATVELLVSPGGRLADYKVNLAVQGSTEPFTIINMNKNLPDPADMVFNPATLNGEPIACRILIKAVINNKGHLDFE